ncbi:MULTISPECIES: Rrf2 family transcriptional regulator [Anaeromyxobacter]|uniref:Rrf2 family transcriptional regulator n=1 Tax=Anaeromyxobacter TaxID=161492 RepID=UPI001F57A150|nr:MULTISPECIES: Rrf2 family transcriptional regulator [unclassified Anaeromyxobacter]
MSPSSRLTVAIHILTLLAHEASGEPVTSEYIAGSVGTNPVVIRRLLAMLRKSKLVRSQGGPGGGWQLVVPARGITLRDVYRAVESEALFPLHASTPNPRCPVGRTIQAALAGRYGEARLALERDLERTTIADLLQEVTRLAR